MGSRSGVKFAAPVHYDDYDIIGLLNPSDLGQHPLRHSRSLRCILPDHRAVPNEHRLYPFEIGDIRHVLIKSRNMGVPKSAASILEPGLQIVVCVVV